MDQRPLRLVEQVQLPLPMFDGPNFQSPKDNNLTDGTGLASNYNLNMGNLTITAKPVDVSGSRPYDATTDADSSILSIGGLVGSETLKLSGSGTLASANVGTGMTISLIPLH